MAETRVMHTSGCKKIPKRSNVIAASAAPTKQCPACGCLLMLAATSCPECGHMFQTREVTQNDGPVVWEELKSGNEFKENERKRDYAERMKDNRELQEWFSLCALADELLPMYYDQHKKISWCLAQFQSHERHVAKQYRPSVSFLSRHGCSHARI